jgi:hypothetical protein
LSRLLVLLAYFFIVKPVFKVVTIEPSADALSVSIREVVKLFCTVFKQGKKGERKECSLICVSPEKQRHIQSISASATLET